MTRSFAAILCAVSISLLNLMPVLAEESSAAASNESNSSAAATEAKNSNSQAAEKAKTESVSDADDSDEISPKKKRLAQKTKESKSDDATKKADSGTGNFVTGWLGGALSKVPRNVPAFLTGAVVGTPVAVVRMSKREIVTSTRELVGDTDNPLFLGAGGILGVPAGLMSGAIYGLYAGVADSWVNADDNPYSKDSFSLGDMK